MSDEPDNDADENGGGTVPLPDLIAIINAALSTSLRTHLAQLAVMAADIAEIKRVQKQGVSGKLFGYSVTLKPPASNGQAS